MSQTGVVSWSQTAATNSTADSNVNWAEGMAAGQVNDSARAQMASVAKWRDDIAGGALTTGGTSTAYTLTTNQSFSALSVLDKMALRVRFHTLNGATPTLNVDSLGAKAININAATAIAANSLRANAVHDLIYDNSLGLFIIVGGASIFPVSHVAYIASGVAPDGWLNASGGTASRSTFADLFAVIGTTYGVGNGSTTFNMPNMSQPVAGVQPIIKT